MIVQANNHAVREAACACMAELCTKVDAAAVERHVPALLAALLVCFKDESWPCRDAASTAAGYAVASYPEVAQSHMEELYKLWLEHLWDNVQSVRENVAAALARVAAAVPADALPLECVPAHLHSLHLPPHARRRALSETCSISRLMEHAHDTSKRKRRTDAACAVPTCWPQRSSKPTARHSVGSRT
jgi:hypothetical protein